MANKLRVIGGQWRSRVLTFTDTPGLRPTPVRIRETLFNWLQYDVVGSRCLDLFAGSGALGFEALSRGAISVTQVEKDAGACQSLRANKAQLSAQKLQIIEMDVQQYLKRENEIFDLIFLDPPFAQGLAEVTCQALTAGTWLAGHAKIYIETERSWNLTDIPDNWRLLKDKQAGDVRYQLFQHQQ
ncbi:MAG TPA: 16S rRNA (guanine(966)-N(2))-methyltransferase RsmD [Methylococcaceae bacterium]|jgi:16S rRNA (guanine966-N2)-methyltransferase|nr:16S rRNA (guanine(966)-N(2))-methyltransferase RsmD [Methylococcaceae bacterium]HIN69185.1 16S rRNA (guanine(966)-N(2))-methyltransferase RsmD [Methylococcales bacterium]HIA46288.1 16S rRNA (guanine(966)-N(2))-methyltransferase RsmD [Methylococcaceae bacterium]HIB61881.1 16S rRNA (guanine(966)-N(2))-methyltransferase RsmD [Methylococcaceae bacterium]HIO13421.1 16S rRNA (guanine(966)-N(2))-methyltransferase RsmD [Methylococcales bacterium]